jgi:hypothetical protein
LIRRCGDRNLSLNNLGLEHQVRLNDRETRRKSVLSLKMRNLGGDLSIIKAIKICRFNLLKINQDIRLGFKPTASIFKPMPTSLREFSFDKAR